MDWNAAIEKNREALKRVLAVLVAMGRQSAIGIRQSEEARAADGPTDCRLPTAECRFLPCYLHRKVLRLLRPAEAAARRLVIVAARNLVVTLPPLRLRKPKPTAMVRNGVGTGILMPRHLQRQAGRPRTAPRTLALSLFDRLRPLRLYRPVLQCVPRILAPGFSAPFPVAVRCPPSPRDSVDARRLALRLQALASALDDLPRQARRFARWRARVKEAAQDNNRDAVGAQNKNRDAEGAQNEKTTRRRRFRRISPLRPGRPPGWCRRPTHDVHEILDVTHGLAILALEKPDTS